MIATTKYDDVSWHTEGDYPAGVPPECAGSHIAYFLAWAIRAGLASSTLRADFSAEWDAVASGDFAALALLAAIDGKLTSDELNEGGRRFAASSYDEYAATWERWCHERGFDSIYHATPTAEHETAAAAILDDAFARFAGH